MPASPTSEADKTLDVAIVGAGFSGLRAAKELHDAGLKYVVLEGMDRVGGKVLSQPTRDDGTAPTELGAAWINDTTQSEMYALAKEYGFELVQQPTSGNSFYQSENGQFSTLPYGVPEPMEEKQLEELERVHEALHKYIEQSNLDEPHLGPEANELDSLTAREFAARKLGDTRVAHKYVTNLSQGLLGCESREMSALYFINYIKSGTGLVNLGSDKKDGGQYLRNRAGNQQFARNLAASLHPDSVKLSDAVQVISQDENSVILGTSGGRMYRAKRVILTMPAPLLPLIKFEPPLPPAKAQLASSGILGYYSKTVLLFDHPWWRDAGLSGIVGSATTESANVGPISFSRDTSVPQDSQWSITCFSVGDKGRQWSKMNAQDRQNAVLKQFRAAFSSVVGEDGVPEPVEIIEKEWSKDPWAQGAPSTVLGPGILTGEAGQTIRDPFKHIHFAGTETAIVWKGYLEGAIRSGVRAAREVIKSLS